MFEAAFDDLDQLTQFMELILAGSGIDYKYECLRDLLVEPSSTRKSKLDPKVFTKEFRTQKVIVFTEFADTARYLHERLVADGVHGRRPPRREAQGPSATR